ncbi:MAG: LysR family transcriptional regulator [Pseudomonadota bacterium]
MKNPGDFRLLFYFIQIVEAGSIRGAARKLGLSPAVVSTALSDLENALSHTLILRSTRSMSLTDRGKRVYEQAVQAVSIVSEILEPQNLEPANISGRVSLTLPTELATNWLPELLKTFGQLYRGVETFIHADDREISLSDSGHEVFIRTTFDTSAKRGPDVVASFPLVLACRADKVPSFTESLEKQIEKIGFLGTEKELRNGVLYCVNQDDPSMGTSLTVRPRLCVNNRQIAFDLVKQGYGAALLISKSVEGDVANGTIALLGQRHSFGYVTVRVLMRDRYPSAAAKALRRFLLDQKRGTPAPLKER